MLPSETTVITSIAEINLGCEQKYRWKAISNTIAALYSLVAAVIIFF